MNILTALTSRFHSISLPVLLLFAFMPAGTSVMKAVPEANFNEGSTVFFTQSSAGYVLIPMDDGQRNHLKAYGVMFQHLTDGHTGKWLLNYRGGSFLTQQNSEIVRRSRIRGVSIEQISPERAQQIIAEVERPNVNMAAIDLEKAPRIAVYTPDHALPWDDAVTLALTYAEVPYEAIYNREVLDGDLDKYDWLHLHHEDFTGQHGKFWSAYRDQPWYIRQVRELESMAAERGYTKVSDMKKAVVWTIRDYISKGGFMFAMCSGTDTFDIALSATEVDIVPTPFDGDPADAKSNEKLNFSNTLAFENFEVTLNPTEYRHANIDIQNVQQRMIEMDEQMDYFTLFDFSAKWDPVPTMLTQNHVSSIKGFYGQTTAFREDVIKKNIVTLAKSPSRNETKYIHGNLGEGFFTFYGGHDPEDYTHRVGDPATELALFPNSPGYRLILNNILFPAAQKKEMQTMRDNQLDFNSCFASSQMSSISPRLTSLNCRPLWFNTFSMY